MLGEIDRLRTEIETVAGEKAAAWHTIDLLRGDLMWMTSRLDAAGIPFSHVLSIPRKVKPLGGGASTGMHSPGHGETSRRIGPHADTSTTAMSTTIRGRFTPAA